MVRRSGDVQGGWAPPDSSARVVEAPAVAALGAAGVAIARGDARWPPGTTDSPLQSRGFDSLEPLGIGGVLDGGFEFLRRHFTVLVGLSAALLLPLQLVDLLVALAAGREAELNTSPLLAAVGSLDTTMPITWLVVGLRVVVLSFLGLTAGVLVSDALAPGVRSSRMLLTGAARRWWVALLVPVLCIPVKMLSGCLVYIGFFLGDALLMCASVVAGAEGTGPLRSFARSWTLGLRNFGTALGVAVGSFVISAVLQVSLYAGPALLASLFVSSEAVLLAVEQIALLTLLVTQPLTAAIAARAYVEFRCRSEALDLALRRRDLGLVA